MRNGGRAACTEVLFNTGECKDDGVQSEEKMDKRKVEKITALVIGVAVVCLSFSGIKDWQTVGIYAGCGWWGRLLYSFFHANLLHATLNAWCLVSIVFIYDIKMWRLLLSFAIAATVPVGIISRVVGGFITPTVGLSGVVFVLFGTLSFEVLRKWYYQMWMLFYLAVGFLFPNTNAWLHLYCYLAGLTIALLNKPIKINGNGKQ